jgi:hypothetical protein
MLVWLSAMSMLMFRWNGLSEIRESELVHTPLGPHASCSMLHIRIAHELVGLFSSGVQPTAEHQCLWDSLK